MGHSLYGDWETAARVANEYPNLYLELTAVMDDRRNILYRNAEKLLMK